MWDNDFNPCQITQIPKKRGEEKLLRVSFLLIPELSPEHLKRHFKFR